MSLDSLNIDPVPTPEDPEHELGFVVRAFDNRSELLGAVAHPGRDEAHDFRILKPA